MEPERPNLKWIKPQLWGILVFLGAIMLLQSMLTGNVAQQLSYSDFKTALRQDQIQDVQISKTLIQGIQRVSPDEGRMGPRDELNSPQTIRFRTGRVEDPGLIKELETHEVSYRGQADSGSLTTFLWWLIPLGLLIFFFKRVAGGMGPAQGMMNFGKSRARIYAEKETGVTFGDVAGVDEAKEELQEIIDFLCHPEKYVVSADFLSQGIFFDL